MQSKLKSKVLWVTLATAIVTFLINAGIINIDSQMAIDGINVIATILVSLGIINNPSDPNKL